MSRLGLRFRPGGVQRRTSNRWAPTLTSHDPGIPTHRTAPIPLESPAGSPPTPVTVTQSGVGTAELTLRVNLSRVFSGIGSSDLQLLISKALAQSGIGTAGLELRVNLSRAFSGIGSSDLQLLISKALAQSGIGTAELELLVNLSRSFTGVGSASLSTLVIPGGAAPAMGDPGSVFREPFDRGYQLWKYGRPRKPTQPPALEQPELATRPLLEIQAEIEALQEYLAQLAALRALRRSERILRRNEELAQAALVAALERQRRLRNNLAAIQAVLWEFF